MNPEMLIFHRLSSLEPRDYRVVFFASHTRKAVDKMSTAHFLFSEVVFKGEHVDFSGFHCASINGIDAVLTVWREISSGNEFKISQSFFDYVRD